MNPLIGQVVDASGIHEKQGEQWIVLTFSDGRQVTIKARTHNGEGYLTVHYDREAMQAKRSA